jgi:hypothetical protein
VLVDLNFKKTDRKNKKTGAEQKKEGNQSLSWRRSQPEERASTGYEPSV